MFQITVTVPYSLHRVHIVGNYIILWTVTIYSINNQQLFFALLPIFLNFTAIRTYLILLIDPMKPNILTPIYKHDHSKPNQNNGTKFPYWLPMLIIMMRVANMNLHFNIF